MSTLEQFFSKNSSLPVGSVKAISITNINVGDTAPNTFSNSGGVWVKSGLVYSQTDYPELFAQIGKVDAADYTPIILSPSSSSFSAIRYIDGVYYATQASATGQSTALVYTSTDGAITWMGSSAIPIGGAVKSVTGFTYGNGLYVAVTDRGSPATSAVIKTSSDFVNWATAYTEPLVPIKDVTYLGGKFLYIQDSTPSSIGSSTDGITWNSYSLGDTASVYSVLYTGSQYLASVGTGRLYYSTDKLNWLSANSGTTSIIYGLMYANALYTVVGAGGMIRTSTDLVTWTARTSGTTSSILDVVYGNITTGNIYAAGGVGGHLRTSTDSVTWTARTSGTTSTINNISVANSRLLYGAVNSFGTSTDGITWTNKVAAGIAATVFRSGTYANGLYVGCGNAGVINTSTDSITWSAATSGTTSSLYHVMYGGGLFVAAGVGGNLRSSTDGVTWTARTTGTTSLIYGTIYDGTKYVIFGAGGMLRTSTDLVTWSAATSGTTNAILAGMYTNGQYILSGASGIIRTSTDLVTWAARTSGTTASLIQLYYLNGRYFAAGVAAMSTSTDSVTWSANTAGITSGNSAVSMHYYNGIYTVTSANTISWNTYTKRSSTDGITWTLDATTSVSGGAAPTAWMDDGTKLVGISQSGGIIYYTFPGTTEQSQLWAFSGGVNTPSNVQNSFYVAGKYYVTQARGIVYTSTNAVSWAVEQAHTTSEPYRMVYDSISGKFIKQVGGSIYTSTDFSAWNSVASPSILANNLALTAHSSQGKTIFGNSLGVLSASDNSVDWTTLPNSPSASFKGTSITYNGTNLYVAVGNAGAVASSTNGINWTSVTTSLTGTLYSVVYGNGVFMVSGAAGLLASSTDGVTWTALNSSTDENILSVNVNGSGFKYVTSNGNIGTSTNGVSWTYSPKVTGATVSAVLSNIESSKYLLRFSTDVNTIYVSSNSGTKEYAPSYNVVTSFLVPTASDASSGFITSASTTDTEASSVYYVKAKL